MKLLRRADTTFGVQRGRFPGATTPDSPGGALGGGVPEVDLAGKENLRMDWNLVQYFSGGELCSDAQRGRFAGLAVPDRPAEVRRGLARGEISRKRDLRKVRRPYLHSAEGQNHVPALREVVSLALLHDRSIRPAAVSE